MPTYVPVIEPDLPGAFLTKHPIDLLRNNEVNDIPVIMGITSKEGAFRTSGQFFKQARPTSFTVEFSQ